MIRYAAFFVLLGIGSGCSAFDFDIEEVTEEVVLEGDLQAFRDGVALPMDVVPSTVFEYDLEDEPAGIHMKEAVLTLTDTEAAALALTIPFSFIDSLEFWIHGKQGSSLSPIRVAWIGAPGPGQNIDMHTNGGPDLTPYIREGFEVRGILNGRVPAASVSFRARMVLAVDVF